MLIKTWAEKVAQAMHVVPGERPSFANVLVDFIDEYDVLAAKTKLSVPAFARALTRAGLTSASGGECDPNALRMQIKRARERRATMRAAEAEQSALVLPPVAAEPVGLGTVAPVRRLPRPAAAGHGGTARDDFSVLKQLERAKPKRARSLDADEG
jgi:hypothetical protein